MPFVTEEIWHQLRDRNEGQDCVISTYPLAKDFDAGLIDQVEIAKEVVAKVRDNRNKNGVKQREPLNVFIAENKLTRELLGQAGLKEMIVKMAFLGTFEFTAEEEIENSTAFMAGTHQFFLELNKEIDVAAEIERLEKELVHYEGSVISIGKKLANERFVNNAPAAVVDKERKKLSDSQAKIDNIKESLAQLRKK